ncbi:saccharopine dehydrogenase family protein [[Limnothrix rosea] IAM M-220]|uniref:saccharopine dehydrogenase family protein n=1 Tax=[Limnothrix rosea] IAM M-220 TaxID=454133 RepID=UPI00095DFEE6|nr:saccharopine dehydrogenase NADP-binding domain-containing protein [[Limnothrix rosea] IAM M-220]OKH18785.1 saccharopine dehydrogenase [[Limnothrix rosea] IAM M-220]
MAQKILILGGTGQIGQRVAADLLEQGSMAITVTGRHAVSHPSCLARENVSFLRLDLDWQDKLQQAIAEHDLVIHCAGPFHRRDGRVLKACIAEGKNYIDVSDHRCLYEKIKPLTIEVEKAGITAICNAGVFPGISNSMVRLGVEQLDQPEKIELYYGVAGSGGAGETVMTTTFLGLLEPFSVWQDGQWVKKQPYSEPEKIHFAAPIGQATVYWFDVAETFTFQESFPVQTVITKFGSIPHIYNQLTRAMTLLPAGMLKKTQVIKGLSKISYGMTQVSDRLTGVGVAMRAIVTGTKDGKSQKITIDFVHEHTAIAAGQGVGLIAELLLTDQLKKKGFYPVEQIIPSPLFLKLAKKRNMSITLNTQPNP